MGLQIVHTVHATSSAVQYIITLRSPARDHYPMKTGLSDAELAEAGDLYPPGTPTDLKLGDFMADLLQNFAFAVEPHELMLRDGSNELDVFLDKLEENL